MGMQLSQSDDTNIMNNAWGLDDAGNWLLDSQNVLHNEVGMPGQQSDC